MTSRQALQTKEWKHELDTLVDVTGITLEDVCEYTDSSYSGNIRFYSRVPKKKTMFIGIGMAFGLSVDQINRWIVRYGDKRKLYAKDLPEDMIWIYLINANRKDRESGINYFRLFDDARDAAMDIYNEVWSELNGKSEGTFTVQNALADVEYDEAFENLRGFVVEHMEGFKTAYSKSRRMLQKYLDAILDTHSNNGIKDMRSLNSLRGYLDDSMINYLAGDAGTINVVDMRTGEKTFNIKAVPKGRKTHIALCLALGMSADEINEYLTYMGYAPLDTENPDEEFLINKLDNWENKHEIQRQFKRKYILGEKNISLEPADELQAVSDMLMLRQDLKYEYARSKKAFPYMKG